MVPCCSEAELALRRAEEKGFVEYVPGEEVFRVVDQGKLTKEQLWALNYVQQSTFKMVEDWGSVWTQHVCL